jgi:hypothetical protein
MFKHNDRAETIGLWLTGIATALILINDHLGVLV